MFNEIMTIFGQGRPTVKNCKARKAELSLKEGKILLDLLGWQTKNVLLTKKEARRLASALLKLSNQI